MCVITQILTSVRQTMEVVALKPRALTLPAASPVPVEMATKETALPAQVILSLMLSCLYVPQLLALTILSVNFLSFKMCLLYRSFLTRSL